MQCSLITSSRFTIQWPVLHLPVMHCRCRAVLPGGAANDLLYCLEGHIAAGSYSPRQLLHVLLALRHVLRAVPRSSGPVRTSLISSWLAATQRCMYDEVRLHVQSRQWQQPHHCDVDQAAAAAARQPALQFDGDLMAMMLLGLGRLRVHPSEQWLQLYMQLLAPLLPATSASDLSKVMIGLAMLGYKPQEQAAQQLLQQSEQLLPGMAQSELVRTMHALPKLQLVPSHTWLQRFYGAIQAAPGQLQLSGFGMVVWALAKLGAKPEQAWMDELVDATFSVAVGSNNSCSNSEATAAAASGATQLKPQHLANILCAFAKLGFTPGPLWMAWFRAQLGQQAGALQELDHFHIEWAWRELHEQYRAAANETGDSSIGVGT